MNFQGQGQGGNGSIPDQIPQDPVDRRDLIQRMLSDINAKVSELEQGYLTNMANAGMLQQYVQQQRGAMEGARTIQQIEAVRETLPFIDVRSPGAGMAISQYYDELQGRAKTPEELQAMAGLKGDVDFLRSQSSLIQGSEDTLSKKLQKLAARYSTSQPTAGKAIKSGLRGLVRGMFMDAEGTPEEEMLRTLQNVIEEASQGLVNVPEHPSKLKDMDLRNLLYHRGLSEIEKLKGQGLSEGFAEEFARKAGNLGGFLSPMGILGKVGAVVGVGAKALGAGSKVAKLASMAGASGAMGIAAASKDPHPMVKRAIDNAIRTGELKEEDRDSALRAARVYSGLSLGATVPVFKWLEGAGRLATLGLSKNFPWVGQAVALPGLMEASEGGVAFTRWLAFQAGSDMAQKSYVTNPRVAGAVETMAKAVLSGDEKAALEAAQHYGKEVLPGLPVFGAVHALHVMAPNRVTLAMKRAARAEFDAIVEGKGAKEAAAPLETLGKEERPPGPAAKMEQALGKEEAAKKMAAEETAQRLDRPDPSESGRIRSKTTEEVLRGEEKEPAPTEADSLERDATAYREQARMLFEQAREAKDPQTRERLESSAEARLEASERFLKAAESSRKGETIETPERPSTEDFVKQYVDVQPKRNLERATRTEADRDKIAEAAEKRERTDRVKREAIVSQFGAHRAAIDRAEGTRRARATGEAATWAAGTLKSGDVIHHPLGDITVSSIRKKGNGYEVRGTRATEGEASTVQAVGSLRKLMEEAEGVTPRARVGPKSKEPKAKPEPSSKATQKAQEAVSEAASAMDAPTVEKKHAATRRAVDAAVESTREAGKQVAEARQQKGNPADGAEVPPQARVRENGDANPEGVLDPHYRTTKEEQVAYTKALEAMQAPFADGAYQGFGKLKGKARWERLEEMAKKGGASGELAEFILSRREVYEGMRLSSRELLAEGSWDHYQTKTNGQVSGFRLGATIKEAWDEFQAIKAGDKVKMTDELMAWAKRHPLLRTEMAPFARAHPLGIRMFADVEAMQQWLFGPGATTKVSGGLGVVADLFPGLGEWVSFEMRAITGSPDAIVGMIERITHQFEKDPDIHVNSFLGKWFPWFEMPMGWAGKIGRDAVHTTASMTRDSYAMWKDILHPRKGLLAGSGVKPDTAESKAIFNALRKGPGSDGWKALESEFPALVSVARAIRNRMQEFKALLIEHSPTVARIRERIDVLGRRMDAVRAGMEKLSEVQDQTKVKGLIAREQAKIQSLERKKANAEKALEVYEREWGLDEYITFINAEKEADMLAFRGHGYPVRGESLVPGKAGAGILRRRTGKAEEVGLVEDVYAALTKYIPQAIGAIHKNAFLHRWSDYLYGKKAPATATDLKAGTERANTVYFEGLDWENQGFRWLHADGTLSKEKPEAGGQVVLVLADYADRTRAYKPSTEGFRAEFQGWVKGELQKGRKMKGGRLELRHPEMGRVVLVDRGLALTDVMVRKGGWFDRATARRARDMEKLLNRLVGGLRSQEVALFDGKGTFRKLGVLANEMKVGMFSVGTAMNALTGAAMLNIGMLGANPKLIYETIKLTAELAIRSHRAKKLLAARGEGYGLAPVEPGQARPDLDLGFAKALRTRQEVLDRMTPEKRAERELIDDAFEDLAMDPIEQGKIADMAGELMEMRTPPKGFGRIRRGWRHVSEAGYIPMSTVESLVRRQGYLGVYLAARRAGKSRAEARQMAFNGVIYNHGIFNKMAASGFQASPLGPWVGGIQTWASHFFGVWQRSPVEFKYRLATVALATMVAGSMLGLGDMTNVAGTSIYDLLPPLEDIIAGAAEGTIAEKWARTGFLPVTMPASLLGLPASLFSGERPPQSSPGVEGARNLAHAAFSAGAGDFSKAGEQLGRASQVAVPSIANNINKAFFSPKVGEKYQVYGLTLGGQSEKPSYQLNQNGIAQLALDWMAGTQSEVFEQIVMNRMARARDKRIGAARSTLRDRAIDLLETVDSARTREKESGVQITEEEREGYQKKWSDLRAEGRAMGYDLDQKELRKSLEMRRMPMPLRGVLASTTKAGKVDALTRVLEGKSWKISPDELRALVTRLRGQKSFREWLQDPAVPAESRTRFQAAYRAWARGQESSPAGR